MISCFQISAGATLPQLEIQLMKDGRLQLYQQAVEPCCTPDECDPYAVDLTNALSVSFQLWKPGRIPVQIQVGGVASVVSPKRGIVRYAWTVADTGSNWGLFYGQFSVVFRDNTLFNFPTQIESLSIEILGP